MFIDLFSGVQLNNEDDHNGALTPFHAKFRHSLAILLKLMLVEKVGVEVLEKELKMKQRRTVKVWVPPEVCLQLEEEARRKRLERRHF